MANVGSVSDDLTSRRDLAASMSSAAQLWLDTLTADQLNAARGATPADDDSDGDRRRWFYTPTDHGGLTVHQQRPAQQRAAMRLVSTGLSHAAYVTVATIIGLENVLDHLDGFSVRFDRERGRDPGLYYLRVFGEPGGSKPWGWRFGGHHVSVNNLIVDGVLVATTPSFLGADPAVSPLLGGAVNRPLGRVEDLGRDLVRSLSPDPASMAILLPRAPSDLVTGNRPVLRDGDRLVPLTGIWRQPFSDPEQWSAMQATSDALDQWAESDADHETVAFRTAPKGIPASHLDAEQRETLRSLLSTYLDRAPAGVSPLGTYADENALDQVHFAWAGSTAPGDPHYYRVQGPGLLLEWDNSQRDGNHAHSVWRNPDADFGMDVLARHRAIHHP